MPCDLSKGCLSIWSCYVHKLPLLVVNVLFPCPTGAHSKSIHLANNRNNMDYFAFLVLFCKSLLLFLNGLFTYGISPDWHASTMCCQVNYDLMENLLVNDLQKMRWLTALLRSCKLKAVVMESTHLTLGIPLSLSPSISPIIIVFSSGPFPTVYLQ